MEDCNEQYSLLATNELPYQPSGAVLQAAITAANHGNRYPDPSAKALRHAIAEHCNLEPEWVVAGNGSGTLIQQIMIASGQKEVVFGWPSFDGFPEIALGLNMKTVTVPLRDNQCKLQDLKIAITPSTSLVIICNPHPPTGSVVTYNELEQLIKDVSQHVTILIDEAYVEFITDPADKIDSIKLVKLYPNVVITRTFSKAYGLSGLRAGYALAQPVLASKISKAGVPFAVSLPAQAAAMHALSHSAVMQVRVNKIVAERKYMAKQLRQLGATVVEGHGNFVWLPLGNMSLDIADKLRKYNVLVKVLAPFGLRISVGTRRDTTTLITAWQALKGEPSMQYDQHLDKSQGTIVSAADIDAHLGTQNQRFITTISRDTVENTRVSTGLVYLPPNHTARMHVHNEYEIIVFIVEGWTVSLFGHELKPIIHKPGDFVFIPPGVPHLGANLSSEQRAIALETRADPYFNEDVEILPQYDEQVAALLEDLRQKYRNGQLPAELGPKRHSAYVYPENRINI